MCIWVEEGWIKYSFEYLIYNFFDKFNVYFYVVCLASGFLQKFLFYFPCCFECNPFLCYLVHAMAIQQPFLVACSVDGKMLVFLKPIWSWTFTSKVNE